MVACERWSQTEVTLYVGYVIILRVKYLNSLLFRSRSFYSMAPPFDRLPLNNLFYFQLFYVISYYYMASSASGQDKPNRAL